MVTGTVALSGGGVVTLSDSSGNASAGTQVIKGSTASDTLDNVNNLITGYGSLGVGTLTVINEAKGTIQATGGTLTIDPGTVTASNQGLIEAVNGALILHGTVDGTKGGTIAALNNGAGSGTVLLDGATLHGGTIETDLKDPASILTMTANGGTLDGASIAAGAQVLVNATNNLTIKGVVADQGTIAVLGNLYGGAASLTINGTMAIAAAGLISLADLSTSASPLTQTISGSSATATLDSAGVISGYGQLGGGTLTLINEASGTIEALAGTLTINTGTTAVINRGLVEMAAASALTLLSNVNNASGTIAVGDGTLGLGGISVSGGVLSSSTKGEFQITGNTTLDGSAVPLTLAAGTNLLISGGSSLTVTGTVDNAGLLTNSGKLSAAGALVNAATVAGDVALTGTGALVNLAGAVVTGTVSAIAAGQTVSNLGTIDGPVTLAGGDRLAIGVASIFGGGLIVNGGGNTLEIGSGPYALTNFDAPSTPQYSMLQIDAGVSLTIDGTDLLAGVTLVNLGTLNLTGFLASAPVQNAGQFNGDITLASGVPLVNSAAGTISGTGLAAVLATSGPVLVTNSGVIDPAAYGVDLAVGGTVVNSAGGVIAGTTAGIKVSGGPGTVTNGGTVVGGGVDAVLLAAGFANRMILTPGARFIGLVDGGNKVGGTVASVLEFAGTPGATRVSGLGTAFVNFSTVTLDAGVYGVLGGTNTLISGQTLTDAGSLNIDAGASLSEADPGVVSGALGAAATVDGTGSVWNANRGLVVGDTGTGTLTVSNLGSLTATASGSLPALALGASTGGSGSFFVTGAQSRLVGQLNVGQSGSGTVTVSNQGTLSTGNDAALDPTEGVDIAKAIGASGQLTVSGSKSLLTNVGRFIVGDAGPGALSVLGGGTLSTAPASRPACQVSSSRTPLRASGSSVTVSGAGSSLSVAGLLQVGLAGSGVLSLSGGAVATAGSLDAGSGAAAVGQIDLSGRRHETDRHRNRERGRQWRRGDVGAERREFLSRQPEHRVAARRVRRADRLGHGQRDRSDRRAEHWQRLGHWRSDGRAGCDHPGRRGQFARRGGVGRRSAGSDGHAGAGPDRWAGGHSRRRRHCRRGRDPGRHAVGWVAGRAGRGARRWHADRERHGAEHDLGRDPANQRRRHDGVDRRGVERGLDHVQRYDDAGRYLYGEQQRGGRDVRRWRRGAAAGRHRGVRRHHRGVATRRSVRDRRRAVVEPGRQQRQYADDDRRRRERGRGGDGSDRLRLGDRRVRI